MFTWNACSVDFLACPESRRRDRDVCRVSPKQCQKALSWLARIAILPHLQALINAPLVKAIVSDDDCPRERKEALPLPLYIVTQWEPYICNGERNDAFCIMLGGVGGAYVAPVGPLRRRQLAGPLPYCSSALISGRDIKSSWLLPYLEALSRSGEATTTLMGDVVPDVMLPCIQPSEFEDSSEFCVVYLFTYVLSQMFVQHFGSRLCLRRSFRFLDMHACGLHILYSFPFNRQTHAPTSLAASVADRARRDILQPGPQFPPAVSLLVADPVVCETGGALQFQRLGSSRAQAMLRVRGHPLLSRDVLVGSPFCVVLLFQMIFCVPPAPQSLREISLVSSSACVQQPIAASQFPGLLRFSQCWELRTHSESNLRAQL